MLMICTHNYINYVNYLHTRIDYVNVHSTPLGPTALPPPVTCDKGESSHLPGGSNPTKMGTFMYLGIIYVSQNSP